MFEPYNFVRNLEYMGKGMLAIFVVMIIIYLVVVLMQKLGLKAPGNKEARYAEPQEPYL